MSDNLEYPYILVPLLYILNMPGLAVFVKVNMSDNSEYPCILVLLLYIVNALNCCIHKVHANSFMLTVYTSPVTLY